MPRHFGEPVYQKIWCLVASKIYFIVLVLYLPTYLVYPFSDPLCLFCKFIFKQFQPNVRPPWKNILECLTFHFRKLCRTFLPYPSPLQSFIWLPNITKKTIKASWHLVSIACQRCNVHSCPHNALSFCYIQLWLMACSHKWSCTDCTVYSIIDSYSFTTRLAAKNLLTR